MSDIQKLLARLPQIDVLLRSSAAQSAVPDLGHRAVVEICRTAVKQAKTLAVEEGIAPENDAIAADIANGCRRARSRLLGRVINGTGVLLHTNLGRAPLGEQVFEYLAEIASGYCNVELDVLERRRGVRGPGVSSLLSQLCGAEDAIVVNNNAASLFLILGEFAQGKEVIVSRGELIQIGGGFRIPDILTGSGATLREVGTTNITSSDDYCSAINDNTAMLLKVHHSNFKMDGFVESPSISMLRQQDLGGALLVSDLGSGNPVRKGDGEFAAEPTPADMLKAGADLVCFSCDKMLGGVQGGVIAGKSELIKRLKKNPIMRVVRVDKLTYGALQYVLTQHLQGKHDNVQLWSMASTTREDLRQRIEQFKSVHNFDSKQVVSIDSDATFGGGSTPGSKIPSAALRLVASHSPDKIAQLFQEHEPPIIGTVHDGYFQIDFRTILPRDEAPLADAIKSIFQGERQ
jgi:L-seryl-tRNA(Ser) seleniumtransferase